jgi:putative CocE/NonD family hydrolase
MKKLIAAAMALLATTALAAAPEPLFPASGTDRPAKYVAPDAGYDYVKRTVEIPMRDGVKLHTVIVVPKGAKGAPVLLTRTPYDADGRAARNKSGSMLAILSQGDELFVQAGYIRIFQDIRGQHGSEGGYVMTLPPRGALNPQKVDNTTDAWDTIDWLVKNVPESNGKVGMIGSSYEGHTVVMALLDPHPALKVAAPQSPMVDGWMGDDWFHYGAWRNGGFSYFVEQEMAKGGHGELITSNADDYDTYLRAGSSGDFAKAHGLDQFGMWRRIAAHPAYDAFWQGQALDKLVAARPSNVPTMWMQGLWDQEDMWGAVHSFEALKAAGHLANNYLVMGPWRHSQVNYDGSSLGPFKWDGDTATKFRRDVLLPFFNQYLKDGPVADTPRAYIYNTGENHWDRFADWPLACQSGCAKPMTPLYLAGNFGLSFAKPAGAGGDSYVSDPAKPVPVRPAPGRPGQWRPVEAVAGDRPAQRRQPPRRAGLRNRTARQTGTDQRRRGRRSVRRDHRHRYRLGRQADRRLSRRICPGAEGAGGYQLAISMDIFRGRYRDSFEHPSAIPANKTVEYEFALPTTNHVFQPGHRIMVQIQSSWFPLYDRNPQTFVPNIFFAKPEDYKKATITVSRAAATPSAVWLPLVDAGQ